ncbi:unnamed protein product [Darwinula stevensoni]|uniref:Uncharacterized protein n=1 Tax=Darwinula stevensoni TaxID=69355 RepID=A0A7R9A3G1_9CRUS|nr:unnamed protein product [Darwinula stevensoni]CAG0887830.1 unnamed protein product [Darwinula stevensoni]
MAPSDTNRYGLPGRLHANGTIGFGICKLDDPMKTGLLSREASIADASTTRCFPPVQRRLGETGRHSGDATVSLDEAPDRLISPRRSSRDEDSDVSHSRFRFSGFSIPMAAITMGLLFFEGSQGHFNRVQHNRYHRTSGFQPLRGFQPLSGYQSYSGFRPVSGYQSYSGFRPVSGYQSYSGFRPVSGYHTHGHAAVRPTARKNFSRRWYHKPHKHLKSKTYPH